MVFIVCRLLSPGGCLAFVQMQLCLFTLPLTLQNDGCLFMTGAARSITRSHPITHTAPSCSTTSTILVQSSVQQLSDLVHRCEDMEERASLCKRSRRETSRCRWWLLIWRNISAPTECKVKSWENTLSVLWIPFSCYLGNSLWFILRKGSLITPSPFHWKKTGWW